jgi:hypothetical protein
VGAKLEAVAWGAELRASAWGGARGRCLRAELGAGGAREELEDGA